MNKMLGFYELRKLMIPTIRWEAFTPNEKLDESKLWTVRSAILTGDDISLPRLVGAPAKESEQFATKLFRQLGEDGLVIYYPYFVAEKSGTIEIKEDSFIIEAVEKDLWNLVTENKIDTHIRYNTETTELSGENSDFLTDDELAQLIQSAKRVASIKHLKEMSMLGKNILLEWSFAKDCDIDKNPTGEQYLVFYEMRVI